MSSINTSFGSISTGRLARFSLAAKQVAGALGAFAKAVRNRREVMHLLELDDRSLKDIGLVRSDVAGVLDGPLSRDPSVILRLRSLERRARARPLSFPERRVTREPCDA